MFLSLLILCCLLPPIVGGLLGMVAYKVTRKKVLIFSHYNKDGRAVYIAYRQI